LFVYEYMSHCDGVHDIFSPVYVYYKYDTDERLQGMAWVYPDMYRLYTEMHKKYYELLGERYTTEQLSRAFSNLIGMLIRAYRYKEYYKDGFEREIDWFLNEPFLQKCVEHYCPTKEYESETIPQYYFNRDRLSILKELKEKSAQIDESKTPFVRRIYVE